MDAKAVITNNTKVVNMNSKVVSKLIKVLYGYYSFEFVYYYILMYKIIKSENDLSKV